MVHGGGSLKRAVEMTLYGPLPAESAVQRATFSIARVRLTTGDALGNGCQPERDQRGHGEHLCV